MNLPLNAPRQRGYGPILATTMLLVCYANASAAGANATTLAIEKQRFTLNGRPTFLLGASYYGGLGAPQEFVLKDLDDLERLGFNWLRVWATWEGFGEDVSAVDAAGEPRQPYWDRLQWLVAECDRRGLVVDVTLTRGRRPSGEAVAGRLPDLEAHRRAVEVIAVAFKAHRNWYMDFANEHDVRDDRYVPTEELSVLREVLRGIDPARLATASFGGHDLEENDVRGMLVDARMDFLCPHRPRSPTSPSETEARARECLSELHRIGRVAPVMFQEPFRRGYADWEPSADDFLTDLRGAVQGGAAGWCFHNGSQRTTPDQHPRRSFDLRTKRLFDQLDDEEQIVVSRAAAIVTENKLP